MNVSIPFGASQLEINALVQRGVDAMIEAEASGGVADVAFMFEQEEVEEVDDDGWNEEVDEVADAGNNDSNANNESTVNDNANEDSHNQYNADNNTMTMEDWVNNVEEEFVAVCKGCFEEPCIFVLNKERLVALDELEHVLLVAPEDVPSNNIRRKRLYREMTLIMNGGPLGAGVRRELPDCCVEGIRQMHPSETFMGYMPE